MVDRETAGCVRIRAGDCCEYCRMPQAVYRERFHIDHIVARQHGGEETIGNLALACLRCNRHKGPNLAGVDPQSDQVVPLFHPRRDHWNEHFSWRGPVLVGLTPCGRATIQTLSINHPDRVQVRQALIDEGVTLPD